MFIFILLNIKINSNEVKRNTIVYITHLAQEIIYDWLMFEKVNTFNSIVSRVRLSLKVNQNSARLDNNR